MRALWALGLLLLAGAARAGDLGEVFDRGAPLPKLDLAPAPPAVPPPAVSSIDSRAQRVIAAEESNLRDPVWPGYRIFAQPFLLYAADVRSTLVAHPNPPKGYHPVASKPFPVFVQDAPLSDLRFHFQYHRPVNGVDSFAYRYKDGDDEARDVETIVHERFHIFQDSAFKEDRIGENEIEPEAELLALAALEQRALKAALNSGDKAGAGRYARMFVAIRRARYKAAPALERGEVNQERLEGTAEYISLRLLERPGVLARVPDQVLAISNRLDRFPDADDMAKGRFYGTGAAQGYLLDLAGAADWKKRVTQGEGPYASMAQAYPVPAGRAAALAAKAKKELGWAALVNEGGAVARDYSTKKTQAIADYQASPGLELAVKIPWADNDVDFGFSSHGPKYTMPDGTQLSPGVDIIDAHSPKFKLHVEDRPCVGTPDVRFHMDPSPSPVLTIDGREQALVDGTYPFAKLSLRGKGFELEGLASGTAEIKSGRVSVKLD